VREDIQALHPGTYSSRSYVRSNTESPLRKLNLKAILNGDSFRILDRVCFEP